jgi:hypothetical protein
LTSHVVQILSNGNIRFVYSDEMSKALQKAGVLHIMRVSHVEPNSNGKWEADLSPIKGPKLGPFKTREAALQAEVKWLEDKYLGKKKSAHRRLS